MTFLELCQLVRQEGGMTGSGPTTVVSQTGEYARIVRWVKDAWVEIQTEKGRNWKFAWVQKEINTTANGQTFDMSSQSVKTPDIDTFTMFLTTDTESEESPLNYIDYHEFRSAYKHIHSVAGAPSIVTVLPNGNLFFEPKPDADYTIRFDARKSVQVLALDTDEPYLAEEYQGAIVYRALMKYERYEESPHHIAAEYANAWDRLLWEQEDIAEEMVVTPS